MGSTPFGGKNVKGNIAGSWPQTPRLPAWNGNTIRLFFFAVNCPNLVQWYGREAQMNAEFDREMVVLEE
jgi:hypothetical protein